MRVLTFAALVLWSGPAIADGYCILQGTNMPLRFRGTIGKTETGNFMKAAPLLDRGHHVGDLYVSADKEGRTTVICYDRVPPDYSARATSEGD